MEHFEPTGVTMATATNFPTAEKIDPVFKIDGKLYRKILQSEALNNPTAIRALVPLAKRDNNGATNKVAWFVPLELPSTEMNGAGEAA